MTAACATRNSTNTASTTSTGASHSKRWATGRSTPLTAIDRRRVEGEVAAGEHHSADEERDERAQGEVLGAEVGYDGADPLGEQRVGGREEQREDGEADGRDNGGPRHRCLVAETGDDAAGSGPATAGRGGPRAARRRRRGRSPERVRPRTRPTAQRPPPASRHRTAIHSASRTTGTVASARHSAAQVRVNGSRRLRLDASSAPPAATQDDEHPEAEVAVGQHDPGQYADAERAEQHPEVAGQRRLGPEVAEDRRR